MSKDFLRIINFNVSVKEIDKKIHFLRKLVKGGSEHSFGIHVAKVAGMPNKVIKRAENILLELEKDDSLDRSKKINSNSNILNQQLSFLDAFIKI